MRPAIIALVFSASISASAQAEDLTGEYKMISSTCMNAENGKVRNSRTMGEAILKLSLKDDGELTHRLSLNYGGQDLKGTLWLKSIEPLSFEFSIRGDFETDGSLVSLKDNLIVNEAITIHEGACPKGQILTTVFEKVASPKSWWSF